MRKKIAILLCGLLMFTNIAFPVFATSTSGLEQQKKEITEKINETKEQKDDVHSELTAQMQEISSLDTSISELDEQITNLSNQISSLEESIKENEKKLEQKQKEHDENQKLMEERLVVMYERGETTFLDVLFNSDSIIAFISNYYMLAELTNCDRELLDTIEKEQDEIKETKTQLENQKEELDSAKKEKETKNNLLKTQRAEREKKASSLSAEEKQLQSKIDDYNAKIKQIDNDIQKIIEDLRRKEEEERRKSGGSSNSSTGISGLKFDGSFIWPCNNKVVTSTVKRRWGRMHKGIDIGARYENVYASASGYAYTLKNPGGYGNYIMIVHGDGYITLYGHLDYYKVSYGQYVSQGQVIAVSGNTGSSTAAHLHFEIRRANNISSYFSMSPLNPLDYLPGGYTFAAGAQTPS